MTVNAGKIPATYIKPQVRISPIVNVVFTLHKSGHRHDGGSPENHQAYGINPRFAAGTFLAIPMMKPYSALL
jgi:hypothetical protein